MHNPAKDAAIVNAVTLMHQLSARGVRGAALRDHAVALLYLLHCHHGSRRWSVEEIARVVDAAADARAAERALVTGRLHQG